MMQLSCDNLTLGYDGMSVVENLNFTVEQGDYICILGENGSGKTTLMKTLLHLQSPLSGNLITGKDFSLNDIGYLPQQNQVRSDFPASVMEIVLSGTISKNKSLIFYGKNERKIAENSLRRLGIYELKKKSFKNLSGGQQQRVLLARAICAAGKMLLLDEPVTGLDPKAAEEMYQSINTLNKKENITIIMISHDIKSVKYANKVLHIGTPMFFGDVSDYKKTIMGREIRDADR